MSEQRRDRMVVIVGPTAGGKTALAVAMARALGGEIISADSMQVYRHLDAGTAKPGAAERAAAVHHLIDIVEPTESWTVAHWLERAEALIADMHGRGVVPIVVGGTNLYVKALLEGMFDGPPADEAFRAAMANVSSTELHKRLAAIDRDAADRIDPQDHKRLVRALEVHHATGQPISVLQQQWSESADKTYRHDPIMIGLNWPPELINPRINARVRQMFAADSGREDLVAETSRLLAAGLLGPQAKEAIGTKQVLDHLAGRCTRDEAMERVKIDTRRFAKTQRTWLKRYRHVHWLDAGALPPAELADQAIQIARRELGQSR
ncbi:MAG: tRNA (adenosine(37)-N6)-dimethylallyltransferase MiaA [Planctomycetes bacterium]|nr:tRNA (adenosine(37)-N6)-dimethylallyltransferase MiaA [Planctomycetota bacterium]